jgi:hypothetical protein
LDEAFLSNNTNFELNHAHKTRFRILTEINDYELFHPISRYLRKFHPKPPNYEQSQGKKSKNKEASFINSWKDNIFCVAFNKIKHFELANSFFFQPERFNS